MTFNEDADPIKALTSLQTAEEIVLFSKSI